MALVIITEVMMSRFAILLEGGACVISSRSEVQTCTKRLLSYNIIRQFAIIVLL